MPLFADRIAALHVHDNHCMHNGDEHLIPGDGIIDFDKVAMRLAAADYKKAIMLEVLTKQSNFYDGVDADTYYSRAASAARVLADRIDAYRVK